MRCRRPLPPLLAWVALAILTTMPVAAQPTPVDIVFLDVGQGDAIVVRAPEGQTALIDAGPGLDIGPQLAELGVGRLDLVVASHPHADHIGGMRQVLESMPVRYYMDNAQPHTTATYLSVLRTLQGRTDIIYLEATARTITLGSVRIHVLPLPARPSSNPNDHSVGLVVEHGDFRAFLSGDSERPELLHWLQARAVPDVALLKAPHHGSDDAVSEPFLAAARPDVVVISVGSGNQFGHPSLAALATYPQYGADVYRTDLHGQVHVRGFEDGSYEVSHGPALVAERAGALADAASSAPGPVSPSAISIHVVADAPGNDHRNPNGEYAVLTNDSDHAIDIAGWMLCDAARHCFRFPTDAAVRARGTVVLFTGIGPSDGERFFMGSRSAVWNNDGDTATLHDAAGRLVAGHVY